MNSLLFLASEDDATPAVRPVEHVELVTRPPLPIFPRITTTQETPVWARRPYRSDLPALPPPSKHFYRGNFCGIRVPGAPYVTGGPEPSNADMIMSCLLDRYPLDVQDKWARTNVSYGYTHGQRSLSHSVFDGEDNGEFGNRLSPSQWTDSLKRQQDHGLWSDVWLMGGPGWRQLWMSGKYWADRLEPWIDLMLKQSVMDTCCVGWQLDTIHTPRGLKDLIDFVASKLKGTDIPLSVHWVSDANAWFDDWVEIERDGKKTGEFYNNTPENERSGFRDRFAFWQAMRGILQNTHFQGNVNAPVDDVQEGLALVMDAQDDTQTTTICEISAQAQFDSNPDRVARFEALRSEIDGNLACYLAMCTRDRRGRTLAGYYNGGQTREGKAL